MTKSDAGKTIKKGTQLCPTMLGKRWIVSGIAAIAIAALSLAGNPLSAQAADILGSASNFAVLAGSTVNSTGASVITGDLGVSPGNAITILPPGIVNGTIHNADTVALQAKTDLTAAYNTLAGLASTANLSGTDLGGLTLIGGVYTFNSSAQLTGGLTLNGQGNSAAQFVFQIGSTLTTASLASITLINGATADNVYFQVGSSATLGTGTAFKGSIVALTDITLTTGVTLLDGRALARNGAVSLDTNQITATAAPEPGSLALLLPVMGVAGMVIRKRRK
jgi:hypothetical protein